MPAGLQHVRGKVIHAFSLLAALAGLLGQQPSSDLPQQRYVQSAIADTPVQVLARQMLGPGRHEDVVRFEVSREPHLGHIDQVRFFRRPRPIGDEFCGQRVEFVGLTFDQPVDQRASRDQHPLRVSGTSSNMQIALARECRLGRGQRFAHVNPQVSLERAMAGLRAFQAALERARGRGRLPFAIDCSSEWDHCGTTAADARRALAALSVEQVSLVESASPDQIDLSVAARPGPVYRVGEGGQLAWQIRMSDFGTPSARLTMTKRIPPPF